ncbi:MAG: 50S ribosomal protein L19 [Leptospira sp.]|nr:50S ribosomal protein L19 [Leptospira sp.]
MNEVLINSIKADIGTKKMGFDVGDTIKVHYRIIESGKERVQVYEGVVISIKNKLSSKSFTVRRISYDVGVERIFPFYSPKISKIELVRKGKVRRAKLFYLREKSGKSSRIKEMRGGQAIVQAERKKQKDAEVIAPTETAANPA